MTNLELRMKRLTAKVSQKVLAKRLTNLGYSITQETVHKMEKGDIKITDKIIELLDEALSRGPGPNSISNKGGPAFWKS